MSTFLEAFFQAFIPLFVAMDPPGLAAIFLALAGNATTEERTRVARLATLTGGLVALLFVFLGRGIFAALGITVGDFQVAGGLILFVLGARELLQSAAAEPPVRMTTEFGVVPLGMPLIVGPAVIATLLLMVESVGLMPTLLALAANLTLVALALSHAEKIASLVGASGMRAVSKIIALLLAAIAVSMVRRGLSG